MTDTSKSAYAYTVWHTQIGERPFWYQLDGWHHPETAFKRARNYALDHGGYVCVKDRSGNVLFGTDPSQLDRAIAAGINHDFVRAA